MILRGHARSYRYCTAIEPVQYPVGAGLPAKWQTLLPNLQQSPATICLFLFQLPLYPPRRKLNRFTQHSLLPFPPRRHRLGALGICSIIRR
ncbi:hypothetical protein F3J45_11560 [Pantoea sp. Ap-967]|nr:hypothetical protein [Pantoea sp. Ap-967]